ncbi:hypothetical protein [Sulfuriferula sp. AH1]|uniref:hypothetical protein n=1 Tax=Sulfuriferula sp. AH1 TaxID=1985873 RepID=UPI0012FCBB75|nr:hypothetical protein [Sulfuriferula sp. AH1]
MHSILPFLPLLVLVAAVAFFAARPTKSKPVRMKRGIGFVLVLLGSLSLMGQFLDSFIANNPVNLDSLLFALAFVSIGIWLARERPDAPPAGPVK